MFLICKINFFAIYLHQKQKNKATKQEWLTKKDKGLIIYRIERNRLKEM